MINKRTLVWVTGSILAIGAGWSALRYAADVKAGTQRVTGRSEVIQTQFGQLEYATAGEGPPFLMVHGTGGGFDQGLTFTESLLPYGYRIIAPSRFGYLRSGFPPDPSSENQAAAFVELLDYLKIDRVVVGGGSAGALSAAQFALRYPERCAALVLIVPAANVRGRDPVQLSALQEFLVRRFTTSDLLFWVGLKMGRDTMIGTLLATDPQRVHQAPQAEQQRVIRILNEIMPVSLRWRGMLNDARLAGNPARMDFSRISVPTFIASSEDDRFGTAQTARDIAAAVPGSRLVVFSTGGHVWVGHEAELWAEVDRFVR